MVDLGIPGLGDAEFVGRGGFGTVYKAREDALNRLVAIKVIRAQEATDAELQLFQRECAAAGSLAWCSDIVSVYSTGTTPDGDPYLLMEYAPGGSLKDRVRASGTVDEGEARAIAARIANALAAAHEAGLLHRDVKPANILFSHSGTPVLADFGIAKALARSGETATGMMAGTIAYMAPELIQDQPGTAASDIFSLGATILEVLTGLTPFGSGSGDTAAAIMRRAIQAEAIDLQHVPVSREFREVLEKCLAIDPAGRYQSGRELVDALSALPEALPSDQTILRPLNSRPPVQSDEIDDATRVRQRTESPSLVAPVPPVPPPPASVATAALPGSTASMPTASGGNAQLWIVLAALAGFVIVIAGVIGAIVLVGSDSSSDSASDKPSGSQSTGESGQAADPAGDEVGSSATLACWDGQIVEEGTPCRTNYDVETVYWAFNFDPGNYACEQSGDRQSAHAYADEICVFPGSDGNIHMAIYRNAERRDQRLKKYGSCKLVDAEKSVLRCGGGRLDRVALRYDSDDVLIYATSTKANGAALDFLLRRMRSLDEVRFGSEEG